MKNCVKVISFGFILLYILLYLNGVFLYKDKTVWSTDYRIEEYSKLPQDSLDVLFLGSSHIMAAIDPIQLWEETGIQGYDYCSRAQTFAFSYAYLRDALKTQSPKVVVLDAYSVLSGKEIYELTYTDFHLSINMDYISFDSKKELIVNYIPIEQWLSFSFPLLKNHNYYKTWERQKDETDAIFMGYCYLNNITAFETPIYSDDIGEMDTIDYHYLNKIIELCEDNEIELILIKTPVVYSDEEYRKVNAVAQICEDNEIEFYDMCKNALNLDIDYSVDMNDANHCNKDGAQKVTKYIGQVLKPKYDFTDSETHCYTYIWQEKQGELIQYKKRGLEENE